MPRYPRSVLLLWWVLTLLIVLASNVHGGTMITVGITNSLSDNTTLLVSCGSTNGTIDLGLQKLHFDESFRWSFTKIYAYEHDPPYRCSFNWEKNGAHYTHLYYAYLLHRDYDCEWCYWSIKENGPCLFIPQNARYICHDWL